MYDRDTYLATAREMMGATLEFVVLQTDRVIEVYEDNGSWQRSDGYGGFMGNVTVAEIQDTLEDMYGEVDLDYISY